MTDDVAKTKVKAKQLFAEKLERNGFKTYWGARIE